jgi:hypothetical protein
VENDAREQVGQDSYRFLSRSDGKVCSHRYLGNFNFGTSMFGSTFKGVKGSYNNFEFDFSFGAV